MSKKTHSQDSNSDPKIAPLGSCYNYNKLKKEGLVSEEKSFEEVWKEMDELDPLTPPCRKTEQESSLEAYTNRMPSFLVIMMLSKHTV